MKQTAVEWLVAELRKYGSPVPRQDEEQAKEMEKQQIIDAYQNGYNDGYNFNLEESEQYYQKNYGKTNITN